MGIGKLVWRSLYKHVQIENISKPINITVIILVSLMKPYSQISESGGRIKHTDNIVLRALKQHLNSVMNQH